MKKFNTLQEITEATGNQVTAQAVINRQLYIRGEGWQTVEISHDLIEEMAEALANLYGGHERTKRRVRNAIAWGRPQHWGLSRTIIEERSNGLGWEYITGQDCTWERNAIRTALK